MNFGKAIDALKKGRLVKRRGWTKTHLVILSGDTISQVNTEKNTLKDYRPTSEAMVAEDWGVIKEIVEHVHIAEIKYGHYASPASNVYGFIIPRTLWENKKTLKEYFRSVGLTHCIDLLDNDLLYLYREGMMLPLLDTNSSI